MNTLTSIILIITAFAILLQFLAWKGHPKNLEEKIKDLGMDSEKIKERIGKEKMYLQIFLVLWLCLGIFGWINFLWKGEYQGLILFFMFTLITLQMRSKFALLQAISHFKDNQ